MCPETVIPGGYILLARKLVDSELMNKPPHYLKLWIWMLCKAFWKDGEILKRGQFQTSISEMQDIGRHKIGNQFVGRLTVDQVRAAYNWFKTSDMISIAKPTDKMTITIINFDSYQDSTLYESHKKADTEALTTANTTRNIMQPADNVIKSNQRTDGKSHGKTQGKPHTIEKKVLKEVKTLETLSLFDLWNEVVTGILPTVRKPVSKDRQKKCDIRLKERPFLEWEKIFRLMITTPFLCGSNDRGWKADFDWIIANDGNAGKVLEGKYEKTGGRAGNNDNRYAAIFAGA